MNGTYDAVIFDMDGVIVNSEPLHAEVEQQLFRELDLNISPGEHAGFLGLSSRDMWEHICRVYRIDIPTDELMSRERAAFQTRLQVEGLPVVPGVVDLVRELTDRGIKLALASSAPRDQIEYVLETTGTGPFFPVRISGDELPRSKPDPTVFLLAAEELRVPPTRSVVIEDALNGVVAAHAAGMRCIAYQPEPAGNADLSSADIVCAGMGAVREVLLGGV